NLSVLPSHSKASMNQPRTGLRYEHREHEAQRINDSPTLATRFPELKTLTLDLGYYNAEGVSKNSQIKCVPNLVNAKSVFRVDCPNKGCIGGDFDLTAELASAVAGRQTSV